MTALSVFELTDADLDALGIPAAPVVPRVGTNGGYGIGRPKFTRADIRDILAARNAGESMASLARRYDCHPSAIRYQLRRHMAEPEPDGQYRIHSTCPRCGIRVDSPSLCGDCWDITGDLGERDTWSQP